MQHEFHDLQYVHCALSKPVQARGQKSDPLANYALGSVVAMALLATDWENGAHIARQRYAMQGF